MERLDILFVFSSMGVFMCYVKLKELKDKSATGSIWIKQWKMLHFS